MTARPDTVGEILERPAPPRPTYDELIRRKWALERELAEVRREMQSRDARAVDDLCNLED